jgi:hypothetical protein
VGLDSKVVLFGTKAHANLAYIVAREAVNVATSVSSSTWFSARLLLSVVMPSLLSLLT